jgi:hypothetical protein
MCTRKTSSFSGNSFGKTTGASMNWIGAVLRMAFVTLAMLLLSSDLLEALRPQRREPLGGRSA